MAAGGLLALLDDIATMLDDVSVMSTMAAKKTAGVLGDDLALNAQQVSGVDASRELPVVWAVTKGSLLNKVILVPIALVLNYLSAPEILNIPWLIPALLMIGGAYLCFEGFEKVMHKFFHHSKEDEIHNKAIEQAIADPTVDLVALEKDKIKGAIRTDFILSAEIIVIALGVLKEHNPVSINIISPEYMLMFTLSLVAIGLTVIVYGLVAAIVKIDDVGLYLTLKKGKGIFKQVLHKIGRFLLAFAPVLMRGLAILGTAAMFLVGGSIIGHGIPTIYQFVEPLSKISSLLPIALDGLVGLTVGAVCVVLVELFKKLSPKS